MGVSRMYRERGGAIEMWRGWLKRIGDWKPIVKDAIARTPVIINFLCLLHVTDSYIISPCLVVGPSMLPTFNLAGDVVLTETLSTRLGRLAPGDVIVARSPDNPRKTVSKRILALEGDIVTYVVDPGHSDLSKTVVVPKGHVWIQGDNIYASMDSRHYGAIPYGLIQSKVLCRVWPLNGFGSVGNLS